MFVYGLFVFFTLAVYCSAKQLAGPFEYTIRKVEFQCPGLVVRPNTIRISTSRVYINGTKSSYTGNVTFPQGVDDGMTAAAEFSVLTNGAWRKNFINIRFGKVCTEAIAMFPKLLKSFMEAAGVPYTGCPIKSGTYNLQNWIPDFTVKTGIFPYNSYRVKFELYKQKEKINCVFVEVDVFPKV